MDKEKQEERFFERMNKNDGARLLISKFIKLTEDGRVINWDNPSNDEYMTASAARLHLDNFDYDVEKAASAYLKAHQRGYEAMERAYIEFVTSKGMEIPVVPEKYFSSEEEYEQFKAEASEFAHDAYNKGYEASYPVRRDEETLEKYTIQ
ncbi:MAG: hypothetical protein AAFO07_33195 [Bacteroidota bacterium]